MSMTRSIPGMISKGLGGWVFDLLPELGAASEVIVAFAEAVDEVTTASAVEVAVKEPKQISTCLARMPAMLAGKTTPDWAAMLHSEFLISPTWRANCQGFRPDRSTRGLPKRL
jgi:hypothetical protein